MGIKRKKKKKFRKWQKNSGAIFEKGDANMGWWDNIKSGSKLDPAMERLKTTYEKFISHPNYNRDVINSPNVLSVLGVMEKDGFDIETLIDYLHEKDKEAGEKYGMPVGDKDEINPMRVRNWIDWSDSMLRRASLELSKEKSETFLRGFAETLGKEITIGVKEVYGGGLSISRMAASFEHDGMNVSVFDTGILLNNHVWVCIVNTNKDLPIFDTLAAMMGLVIVNPTQIATLELGIKIAKIFNSPDGGVYAFRLFTPFALHRGENFELRDFLRNSSMDEKFPGKREEIKEAILEIYGNSRGFF